MGSITFSTLLIYLIFRSIPLLFFFSGVWSSFSVAPFLIYHFSNILHLLTTQCNFFCSASTSIFFLMYMHCVCCWKCSDGQCSKISGHWNPCHVRSQWAMATWKVNVPQLSHFFLAIWEHNLVSFLLKNSTSSCPKHLYLDFCMLFKYTCKV